MLGNQMVKVNVIKIRVVEFIRDHGEMAKDMGKEHTLTETEESTLENGRME